MHRDANWRRAVGGDSKGQFIKWGAQVLHALGQAIEALHDDNLVHGGVNGRHVLITPAMQMRLAGMSSSPRHWLSTKPSREEGKEVSEEGGTRGATAATARDGQAAGCQPGLREAKTWADILRRQAARPPANFNDHPGDRLGTPSREPLQPHPPR